MKYIPKKRKVVSKEESISKFNFAATKDLNKIAKLVKGLVLQKEARKLKNMVNFSTFFTSKCVVF